MSVSNSSLMRFKAIRCSSLPQVLDWANSEEAQIDQGQTQTSHRLIETPNDVKLCPESSVSSPCPSVYSPCRSLFLANAALSLLNLACFLLDQQIKAQAAAFEREGGFTERLYRVRTEAKKGD